MPSHEHDQFIVERLATAPKSASISDARQDFEDLMARYPPPPEANIETVYIDHLEADWVTVPRSVPGRVIYYLHGGAYMIGSHVAYRGFAARLAAATSARVFVINYRLAPENPFPAAVDDALLGWRHLVGSGIEPRQVMFGGDSAGGGLALATLTTLRDSNMPLPACTVLFSPWTDLECTGESQKPGVVDDPFFTADGIRALGKAYAGARTRDPLASPLRADLSGLPPLLVFAGTREILLDDAARVVRKANTAGVEAQIEIGEGLIHVWQAYDLPESRQSFATSGAFMAKHIFG